MIAPAELIQQWNELHERRKEADAKALSYLTDTFRQIVDYYQDDAKKMKEVEKRLGIELAQYHSIKGPHDLTEKQRGNLLDFVECGDPLDLADVLVEIDNAEMVKGI